ncbi:hypothetical protein D3C86_2152500 [compost metagenome]
MRTSCCTARATVRRMIEGSEAWKPQAMLAQSMCGMTSASRPMVQAPKLSPISQLRSRRLMAGFP